MALALFAQAAHAFAPAVFELLRGAGLDRGTALAAGALQLAAAVYLRGGRRPAA